MSAQAPANPSVSVVRLTIPADLYRLAVIDVATFSKEPIYDWIYEDRFRHISELTASYLDQLASDMKGNERLITVIEAPYNPHEFDNFPVNMPYDAHLPSAAPAPGTPVPVAYAIWSWQRDKFDENKFRELFGAHQMTIAEYNEFPASQSGAPTHRQHWDDYVSKMDEMKKYISDCEIELDRLVVHPAYQRQGHGRALLEWGMNICGAEGLSIGVKAVGTGAAMYRALGFQWQGSWSLAGDPGSPSGATGCAMTWPGFGNVG